MHFALLALSIRLSCRCQYAIDESYCLVCLFLVDLPEIKGTHRKFRSIVSSIIGKSSKIFVASFSKKLMTEISTWTYFCYIMITRLSFNSFPLFESLSELLCVSVLPFFVCKRMAMICSLFITIFVFASALKRPIYIVLTCCSCFLIDVL